MRGMPKRVLLEEGNGAGEGNRTLVASLGSWSIAIMLHPRKEEAECVR